MAFCGLCGNKVDDGTRFCPNCGNDVSATASTQGSATNNNDFSAKIKELTNTPDTTAEFDPNDIAQNKAMGILAYFGPLCFVSLFAVKDSKFAKFHGNQGLTLLIASVAWTIALSIIRGILFMISFDLLVVVGGILGFVSIVFPVVAIIGIINAANGKAKELPVIGKIKLIQ